MKKVLPALATILLLTGCDGLFGPKDTGEAVVVMTQNVYLGADLDPILLASSPSEVPALVAAAWAGLQATDFRSRAVEIVDLIEAASPDLIGLQEMITVYIQDPGDFLAGNPVQAGVDTVDFEAILLAELTSRGLGYSIAAKNTDFDIEMPAATSDTTYVDLRIVDHEIILKKADVVVSNVSTGTFVYNIALEVGGTGGPSVEVTRGWARMDATIGDKTFHFVSTHLEVEQPVPQIQQFQAAELLQILNSVAGPVVLLGDFNAPAAGGGNQVYQDLVAAGFTDTWSVLMSGSAGFTCCQDPTLTNTSSNLYERIDLILTRGGVDHDLIDILGEEPADRTPGGLWPADHAGVVATLRVR